MVSQATHWEGWVDDGYSGCFEIAWEEGSVEAAGSLLFATMSPEEVSAGALIGAEASSLVFLPAALRSRTASAWRRQLAWV